MSSRLNPEDQQRVSVYLNAPQQQIERQAFRPWRLLAVLLAIVLGLGVLSRLLSSLAH